MPIVLAQNMKSISTIAAQPDTLNSRMHLIIMMDIAGYTGNQIAEDLQMSVARVSVIRNSPLFTQQRDKEREKLYEQVKQKASDKVVAGDPVENALKNAALEAALMKVELMRNAKSEMVKTSNADGILDRAGYKTKQDKTVISVEVTEKMANRFERALLYNEPRTDGRGTKISITKEVS